MDWDVYFTERFEKWLLEQDIKTQEDILAHIGLLEKKGPNLSRPYADTVKESKFPNMKELRVQSQGNPYRLFFAFNPQREAIILIADNKKGWKDSDFYKKMIPLADRIFADVLDEKR